MTDKTLAKDQPAPPAARPHEGDSLRTIIYAVLVALVIRTFAFEPFNIPSSSMVPTLLVGDFLFVSKYAYGYAGRGTFLGLPLFEGRIGEKHMPQRGDVVVFKLPRDGHTDYIKRLIGLPGDNIQMKEGLLYINDKPVGRAQLPTPVAEPGAPPPEGVTDYTEPLPDGPRHVIRERNDTGPLDNTQVFTVPPRHYFMMGDNRDNSQDSRTPMVAFVPEENLVGRAEVIFFSLDDSVPLWEFWRWPQAVRWHRLFQKIG